MTEIDRTPDGLVTTKLTEILLNGSNVAMLIPGGRPDDVTGI